MGPMGPMLDPPQGGGEQQLAGGDVVDHAAAQGGFGREGLAAEDDVERRGTPMRRGRRVEPPHAGRMPSWVSGSPIFVARSAVAMRHWQARHNS